MDILQYYCRYLVISLFCFAAAAFFEHNAAQLTGRHAAEMQGVATMYQSF